MSAHLMAATAFAALTLATASPLAAADLGGDDYTETERYSYNETRRVDRYVDEGSYDRRADFDDEDDVRYEGPGRGQRAYAYDARESCVPRHAIRDRLHDEGWTDIERVDVRDGAAILKARRATSGQPYALKVDRCTGDIIDARKSNYVYGEYRPRY